MSATFGATVRAGVVSTEGGGVGYDAAAAINAPFADDKAALRVSGFYTHDDGFVDNLAHGRDDVNEVERLRRTRGSARETGRQAFAAARGVRAEHRARRHRVRGLRIRERRADRRRSRPAASARRAVRAGVPARQRHARLRLRECRADVHQQLSDRAQPRDHRCLRVLRAGARRQRHRAGLDRGGEGERDRQVHAGGAAQRQRHAARLVDRRVLHRRGQRPVPDAEFLAAERRRVPGEPAHREPAEHLPGVRGLRHAHLAPHAEARSSPAGCATRTTRRISSRSAPARWSFPCRSAARRTASSRTRRRSAIARARSSCPICATRPAIGPAARTQSQRPERPAARRSDVRSPTSCAATRAASKPAAPIAASASMPRCTSSSGTTCRSTPCATASA